MTRAKNDKQRWCVWLCCCFRTRRHHDRLHRLHAGARADQLKHSARPRVREVRGTGGGKGDALDGRQAVRGGLPLQPVQPQDALRKVCATHRRAAAEAQRVYEERMRKSMERSMQAPKKRVGRQVMWRSRPLKKNVQLDPVADEEDPDGRAHKLPRGPWNPHLPSF